MDDGVATTDAPVVAERPVEGLQEKVLPPEAVNTVPFPLQIVAEVGVMDILGPATVVTFTVAIAEQPKASTPATV